jgi:hypothetical protein
LAAVAFLEEVLTALVLEVRHLVYLWNLRRYCLAWGRVVKLASHYDLEIYQEH